MTPLSKPTPPQIEAPKQMPGRMGQALRDVCSQGIALKRAIDVIQIPMNRGEQPSNAMIDQFLTEVDGPFKELRQALDDLGFALQVKRHDEERPAASTATKDDPEWHANPQIGATIPVKRSVGWGDATGDSDPENPGT